MACSLLEQVEDGDMRTKRELGDASAPLRLRRSLVGALLGVVCLGLVESTSATPATSAGVLVANWPLLGMGETDLSSASTPASRDLQIPPVLLLAPRNSHVLVIGDSQPDSYWRQLRDALATAGWSADRSTFSGASACDFFLNGPSNREFGASVGVVSFRGNSYTTCAHEVSHDPSLVALHTAAAVEEICATSGFDACVIVGQPVEVPPSDMKVDTRRLNELLRDMAERHPNYVFVDCGAAVGTADGSFNRLTRDVDGVHLNPSGMQLTVDCIASSF